MALSFNGTTDYLTQSALLSAVPMTMECWVNLPNIVGTKYAVSIGDQGSSVTNDFWGLRVANATAGAISERAGTGAVAASAGSLTSGTWFHIVAVFASATSRLIYLNGVSSSSSTSNTPLTVTTTAIGAVFNGGLTPVSLMAGSVAYPAIRNIALSPTDVTALYNGGAGADPRSVQGSSIVSFSLFDTGPPFLDVGAGNTWTVTGSPTIVADPFPIVNPVTINFTGTASTVDINYLEYSNVALSSPVDTFSNNTGTSATPSTNTFTTTSPNDLILAAATSTGVTLSSGASYSTRTSSANAITEDRLVSATGSYSATAGLSASSLWVIQAIALSSSVQATTLSGLTGQISVSGVVKETLRPMSPLTGAAFVSGAIKTALAPVLAGQVSVSGLVNVSLSGSTLVLSGLTGQVSASGVERTSLNPLSGITGHVSVSGVLQISVTGAPLNLSGLTGQVSATGATNPALAPVLTGQVSVTGVTKATLSLSTLTGAVSVSGALNVTLVGTIALSGLSGQISAVGVVHESLSPKSGLTGQVSVSGAVQPALAPVLAGSVSVTGVQTTQAILSLSPLTGAVSISAGTLNLTFPQGSSNTFHLSFLTGVIGMTGVTNITAPPPGMAMAIVEVPSSAQLALLQPYATYLEDGVTPVSIPTNYPNPSGNWYPH